MAEGSSLIRLQHWHGLLLAETRRLYRGDALREQLVAKSTEIASNMRADANFVEPDPVESRKAINREHGYSARMK